MHRINDDRILIFRWIIIFFLLKKGGKRIKPPNKAVAINIILHLTSLAALRGKTNPGNGCYHSHPGKQHSDREWEMLCVATCAEQIMLMVQCSTVRSDLERRVTCPLRRCRPSVSLYTQICLRLKQLHFLCVSEMQSKGQASVENKWYRVRVRQRAGTTYFMTTEKNRLKPFCICGSTCTALLSRVRGHDNYTTQEELIH